MAVDVWTGFTVSFGTTGILLKVRKFGWSAPQKAVADVTHQGSTQPSSDRQHGGREFVTGKLTDPGEWVLEIVHDPTVNFPVKSGAVFETITMQPPSSVCAGAFVASGKLLGPPQFSRDIDDAPIATLTIKLTGVVTMPSS